MNKNKQSGMSMWGVMILMIIVITNAFMAIKIVPMYMENATVNRAMESLREPLRKERLPAKKIWQKIYRTLIVNNVRYIGRDDTKIKQTSSKSTITIEYEVRKNVLYNLDVVAKFKNVLEVRRGSMGRSARTPARVGVPRPLAVTRRGHSPQRRAGQQRTPGIPRRRGARLRHRRHALPTLSRCQRG